MSRSRALPALVGTMVVLLSLVSCLTIDAKATVDLSLLEGVWEGTHEYLDYQGDATRIQLPATLMVSLKRGDNATASAEATLVFLNGEPNGSTTTDEMTLRYFPFESLIEYGGNWAITEADTDPQTAYLRLVFAGKGEDDDRPALVRQTIERLGGALTLRKEVRYEDVTEFIIRSEYRLRQTN